MTEMSREEFRAELRDALSVCATKDDLAGFATKDDLAGFATKDDLAGFATKDDLKAVRDDLKGFATKDDLMAMKNELKGRLDAGLKHLELVCSNISHDVVSVKGELFDMKDRMADKDSVSAMITIGQHLRGRWEEIYEAVNDRSQKLDAMGNHVQDHEARLLALERRSGPVVGEGE